MRIRGSRRAKRRIRPIFQPNPAQDRFLRSLQPGGIHLLRSGVGLGKTTLIQFLACHLAALNRRVDGLIVSHTLNHLRTEIIPGVIAGLRQMGLFRFHHKTDRIIYLTHGGRIQYGSADKPSSLDGRNVGWLLGDEIRWWPEDSFNKATSRVRDRRADFPAECYLSTPAMNWMYEQFAHATDIIQVTGSTDENAINLQPGYFEKLRRKFSTKLYEQYVKGGWVLLTGAVFNEFNTDKHVVPLQPSPIYPVDVAVDPGINRGAVGFLQVIPKCPQHAAFDCVHYLDEWMPNDLPTMYWPDQVAARFAKNGWRRGDLCIDPAAESRDVRTGIPEEQMWRDAGWRVKWNRNPVATYIPNGIEMIRAKLKNAADETSLYISDRLVGEGHERGIIKSLQLSQYPERKDGRPVTDHPVKDGVYDHARDMLRYYMVNQLPIESLQVRGVY